MINKKNSFLLSIKIINAFKSFSLFSYLLKLKINYIIIKKLRVDQESI